MRYSIEQVFEKTSLVDRFRNLRTGLYGDIIELVPN